jgi:branched-chain amino acid transport system ATP-binding protein
MPAPDIARLGVGYVPQGRGLFAGMTVKENLALGRLARKTDGSNGVVWDEAMIFEHFPRLKERMNVAADYLSGGEQQMVAVGRALMLRPKLLLLDEPSHGLAPKVVEEMHEAFTAIHRRGTSILLVEQNVELALEVATRGYVLEAGHVTLEGTAAELRANPAVVAAYLGV